MKIVSLELHLQACGITELGKALLEEVCTRGLGIGPVNSERTG